MTFKVSSCQLFIKTKAHAVHEIPFVTKVYVVDYSLKSPVDNPLIYELYQFMSKPALHMQKQRCRSAAR